jgi:uncharacterized protein
MKKKSNKIDWDFYAIIHDILQNEDIKMLSRINHHGKSILNHSLKVAIISYRIGKKLKLDKISLARGALLHDFFLYDWNNGAKVLGYKFYEIHKMHAFIHPRIALANARNHFQLNRIECDIISRHMFPLTLLPPRYKEGWLVMIVDKWVTFRETPQYMRFIRNKNEPRRNLGDCLS